MTISADVSDHLPLFDQALAWLALGHKVALATVTQTWGSAPRAVGSHLVIRDDGLFEGSVSGGCVEGAVIAEALACLAQNSFKRCAFGVADAKAWEVGLACGGQISVLVQPIQADFFSPDLLSDIAGLTRAGGKAIVDSDSGTGRSGKDLAGENILRISYMPAARLAIIGAVHIAQHLAPMASQIGYDVLVIDPRGMFAASGRMTGINVSTAWPDDCLADWKPNAASAVVALTHDPKLDDPALIAALKSDAFYIAALGSRKNHAGRLERLRAAGFSQADVSRVHGPAGLDIGARSPAEIAVSILAQMIATRRQK